MSLEALIVIFSIVVIVFVLAFTRLPADIVFFGMLAFLMTVPIPTEVGIKFGLVAVESALSGFSNGGMVTVAFLYIVAFGIRNTGSIDYIGQFLFGNLTSVRVAIARIIIPVIGLSAFLNNTPLVSIMIPVINDISKKFKIHASKLMIPVSYAAILGGTCSVIGTSTNLVVNGLIVNEAKLPSLGLFDIAIIGIPCAIIGALFLIVIGPLLLPDRGSNLKKFEDSKEYTVEMMVTKSSNLIGKSIQDAGLRHLENIFLAQIIRDDEIVPSSPHEKLRSGDRLLFTGVVDSVKELQNFRGLAPATDQVFKLNSPRFKRQLFEVVISNTSPLIGKTVRDGKFRSFYDAVVLAVARNNERINKKIGDIVLNGGDTLLIEATPYFIDKYRDSRDFYLISSIDDSSPRNYDKAPVAIGILLLMIVLVSLNFISMLKASMIAAIVMVLSRCCTLTQAKRSIDVSVLLVIASALGVGKAMEQSGLSEYLSSFIISGAGNSVFLSVIYIYIVTSLLTSFVTNNAAVALTFPIAMLLSSKLGVSIIPFALTIMMAGSASFATPYGYQTNLMVYGPGGYKFIDYLRIGIPMNILIGLITILMVKIVFGL